MLDTQVYSLSQAEKIVGGKKHLERLVLEGKVSEKIKRGRLYYNAREIALHAKNYR